MTIIEIEEIIKDERVAVAEYLGDGSFLYHFIGDYKPYKELTDICQNMWLYKNIVKISPQITQHSEVRKLTLVIYISGVIEEGVYGSENY